MSPNKPAASTRATKKQSAPKLSANKITKTMLQQKQQHDEKHRGSQQRLRSKLDTLYEDVLTQVDTSEDVNARQKTAVLSLLVEAIDHHMLERRRLLAELTALGVPVEEQLLKGRYIRPQFWEAAPVTPGSPMTQGSPITLDPLVTPDPSTNQGPPAVQDPPATQGPPSISPFHPHEGLFDDLSDQFSLSMASMFDNSAYMWS